MALWKVLFRVPTFSYSRIIPARHRKHFLFVRLPTVVSVKTIVGIEGSWVRSHRGQEIFSSTEVLRGSGVVSASHLVGMERFSPACRGPCCEIDLTLPLNAEVKNE